MRSYLVIDIDTLKKRKDLLDKAIRTTRYRIRGKLIILLIKGDKPTAEWAEHVRTAISYNFDVPIYIYTLSNSDEAIEHLRDSCSDRGYILLYKGIDSDIASHIDSSLSKCFEAIYIDKDH